MGRVKLTAGRKSSGPVVLHLDRGIAHDLLLALTQALEPHPKSIAGVKGKALKGSHLKATSPKAKSSARKGPKGKSSKGKSSKRSR